LLDAFKTGDVCALATVANATDVKSLLDFATKTLSVAVLGCYNTFSCANFHCKTGSAPVTASY
jgi:hypothetical protein